VPDLDPLVHTKTAESRSWHDVGVKTSVPPDASAAPQVACTGALTVLYDGSCPLCRREIGVYRALTPLQPIAFADVGDAAAALPELPPGTTREQLLARFHVRHADGRLDSGARAFLALWAALPGWRVLARLGALPGVPALMEGAYGAFLRLRPALQRVAHALDRRAVAAPAVVLADAPTTDVTRRTP
jgi:predicted DCC family thiol-disulfide oxidoreductase YuxK